MPTDDRDGGRARKAGHQENTKERGSPATGDIGTAVIDENDLGQGVSAPTRFPYSRRTLRRAGTAAVPSRI